MWRSFIFIKSFERNAPPQVFLSLNEANGLDLRKRPLLLGLRVNSFMSIFKCFLIKNAE